MSKRKIIRNLAFSVFTLSSLNTAPTQKTVLGLGAALMQKTVLGLGAALMQFADASCPCYYSFPSIVCRAPFLSDSRSLAWEERCGEEGKVSLSDKEVETLWSKWNCAEFNIHPVVIGVRPVTVLCEPVISRELSAHERALAATVTATARNTKTSTKTMTPSRTVTVTGAPTGSVTTSATPTSTGTVTTTRTLTITLVMGAPSTNSTTVTTTYCGLLCQLFGTTTTSATASSTTSTNTRTLTDTLTKTDTTTTQTTTETETVTFTVTFTETGTTSTSTQTDTKTSTTKTETGTETGTKTTTTSSMTLPLNLNPITFVNLPTLQMPGISTTPLVTSATETLTPTTSTFTFTVTSTVTAPMLVVPQTDNGTIILNAIENRDYTKQSPNTISNGSNNTSSNASTLVHGPQKTTVSPVRDTQPPKTSKMIVGVANHAPTNSITLLYTLIALYMMRG